MKFLHYILAAFVVLFTITAISAANDIGPCVDKLGSTICTNLAKDCESAQWSTLIKSNCRATCKQC